LVATWREAFTGMVADAMDDAERYGVALPRPVDEIRQLVVDSLFLFRSLGTLNGIAVFSKAMATLF
jgi:hypothetical protein